MDGALVSAARRVSALACLVVAGACANETSTRTDTVDPQAGAREYVEARAKWDGANIVTEWSAANMKLTRTYASSADGKVLTVRVAPEEKKGGPPPRPPMTLVYDRE